jgi:hypothetical protein
VALNARGLDELPLSIEYDSVHNRDFSHELHDGESLIYIMNTDALMSCLFAKSLHCDFFFLPD